MQRWQPSDRIANEFIRFAAAINNAREGTVHHDTLTKLILTLIQKGDFEVTLEETADLLHMREDHLRRVLKNKTLIEGKDYQILYHQSVSSKGRRKQITLLSLNCFKSIIHLCRNARAFEVQKYFHLAEELWRQEHIEAIEDRLRVEDESITELKGATFWSDTQYQDGPCIYVVEIDRGQNEPVKYKVGRTIRLGTRLYELKNKIPGLISLKYYKCFDHHEFLEVCVHTLLRNYRLFQEESSTEIFEADIKKVITAVEICERNCKSVIQEFEAVDSAT